MQLLGKLLARGLAAVEIVLVFLASASSTAATSTGSDHSTFGPTGAGSVLVMVPDGAGEACGAGEAEGAEVEGAAEAERPKIADMMSPKMLMTDAPEV
jgi:hypothetical protein